MKIYLVFFLFLTTILTTFSQIDCKKLTSKKDGASSKNKCCKKNADIANRILLYDNQAGNLDSIIGKHAPFGLAKPKSKNVIILYNRNYILGYDTVHKIASWLQYKLTEKKDIDNSIKRTDCFRYDPRVPKHLQVGYQDYKNSLNLQRGHLKPSNDSKQNLTENLNSFVMTNMAPQYGQLNQCEWQLIEDFITKHSRVDSVKNAWIISGSAFGDKEIWNIEGAAIPHFFYKIYFFESNARWYYWTFFFDHNNELKPIQEFINELRNNHLSIREIEKICRVNFYVIKKGINKVEKNPLDQFDYKVLPDHYVGWCNKYLQEE